MECWRYCANAVEQGSLSMLYIIYSNMRIINRIYTEHLQGWKNAVAEDRLEDIHSLH